MMSYLILSPRYYGSVDSYAATRISTQLRRSYKILESKKMSLDFIAFRYSNHDALSLHEYYMLLEVLSFCKHYNITPLLNLSAYKLEILLLLWLHGFFIGIHFKESDMHLLHDNVSLALKECYSMLRLCDSMPRDKLKTLYKSLSNTSEQTAKTLSTLCFNATYFKRFATPLHQALRQYEGNTNYTHKATTNEVPIFVSTHNMDDASQMLSLGVDYVTISPIFYDKGNKALGLSYLHALSSELKKATFALGGVNDDEKVKQIELCGLAGFASISYFLQ